MADLKQLMSVVLPDRIGELIVTDLDCRMITRNHGLDFDDAKWRSWSVTFEADFPESNELEWEIADRESDCYYKVRSFLISGDSPGADGQDCIVHHIVDVSEYAELFRDLSVYSGELRRISQCQSRLISSISNEPEDCLPIALDFFGAETAVLKIWFRERETVYVRTRDGSDTVTDESGLTELCGYRGIGGEGYSMLISRTGESSERLKNLLSGEYRLFIENTLLKKTIIYDSEHDIMTDMYNRVKFSDLAATEVHEYRSVAILNLDVNYLKRTNDELGHEAGNLLLIKAAKSLKAICSDTVYGFRMGGDEFMVMAGNISRSEGEELVKKWREALGRINEEEPFPECVMACGFAYAEAPFVLREVIDESDALMYADKRAIKLSRGEDPDAR